MTLRRPQTFGAALLLALLLLAGAFAQPVAAGPAGPQNYRNPLPVSAGDALVESCADPALIRAQDPADPHWYMYCTTDPLNGADRDANGNLIFHLIPVLRSTDLVEWEYVGDAFTSRPAWMPANEGMWAPNIEYFNGQYYLYFTAPSTSLPGGGSAIGVGVSATPFGPFVASETPVVEPHAAPCCPGSRRWVFDPDVITDPSGQKWIYYGSYFGGISVRQLSADGLSSNPATQVEVAIANRYEGGHVVYRAPYYYLFASATDCCRGPLTGYSVFVGRSLSPTGPFVDREGNSFMAGRVGGTPVISMNGNRWVGPGHNFVFQDAAGDWWTVYHAIDRNDPYFEGAVGFTKRPVLLDPVDWIDGWPTVRAGNWASDTPQPAPAAQEGDRSRYNPKPPRPDRLGQLLERYSEEFDDANLGPEWSWVRQPASGYGFANGVFSFDIQPADLFVDSDTASVLTGPLPGGNYVVETKLRLPLPAEGCCWNFSQAGLVIYGDDDNFIKLTHVSIWETRQTEFAREVDTPELNGPLPPNPPGHQWRYGNTVAGTPGEVTYLRIARRQHAGEEHYTAYTSQDGETWVRGGTWTHELGRDARLGLVAMGGGADGHSFDFTAEFDYVRVYRLR
jgi:arabinan endo-1,5-alpha-L-arabinosidase